MTPQRFVLLDRDVLTSNAIIWRRRTGWSCCRAPWKEGIAFRSWGLGWRSNRISRASAGATSAGRHWLRSTIVCGNCSGKAAWLDGIYVCPHIEEDNCTCRKPRPGLAQRAAADLGLRSPSSFVIGDKPSDIELGRRIGATTFLVRTGYGEQHAGET